MKKGKGGLKNALGRHQVKETEKARREAYEKRQQELQKQQGQGKPKKSTLKTGAASSRKKIIQPFRDGESVLFVGEGNFSFARAFAQRFPKSAKVSIATSYDSQEEAGKKYADLSEILTTLEEAGMTVLFSVDAQKLEKTKTLKKRGSSDAGRFDKVVFNFPHVGLGEKDEQRNIKLNQILLLRFLKSVKPFLKADDPSELGSLKRKNTGSASRKRKRPDASGGADIEEDESLPSDPESDEEGKDGTAVARISACGTVLVTLFTCKPYNEWALPALAKNGPSIGSSLLPFPESREAASTQPRYKVERSFAFVKEEWPGYDHRRTVGHKDGKSSLLDREHGGARTWELSLA